MATIYPNTLIEVAKKYAPNSFVADQYSINDLKKEVKKGNPVLIWGTLNRFEPARMRWCGFGAEPTNGHTMVLCGYHGDELYFADPIEGHYWINERQVEYVYIERSKKAIVVQ